MRPRGDEPPWDRGPGCVWGGGGGDYRPGRRRHHRVQPDRVLVTADILSGFSQADASVPKRKPLSFSFLVNGDDLIWGGDVRVKLECLCCIQ